MVEVTISIGPLFASSIASPNNFPTKPMDLKAIESTPARAPGPKMATNSRAQIKELTERVDTKINWAIQLSVLFEVKLRAAKKANGTAMSSEIKVPSVAI